MKHVESNEQAFTRSGMILGLVAYMAVVVLIAWVFC